MTQCRDKRWSITIHKILPTKKVAASTQRFCTHAQAKREAAKLSKRSKILAVEIKSRDANGAVMHHGEYQRGEYWAW